MVRYQNNNIDISWHKSSCLHNRISVTTPDNLLVNFLSCYRCLMLFLCSFVEDLGRLRNIDRRLERMSYFILGGGLPVACLLINEAKKKPRVSCITIRNRSIAKIYNNFIFLARFALNERGFRMRNTIL